LPRFEFMKLLTLRSVSCSEKVGVENESMNGIIPAK
jgi:hypothetical protein